MKNVFQNTLYVTRDGSYVRKRGETVVVEVDGEEALRVPVHHIASLVVFGRTMVSPALVEMCSEKGLSLVYLGRNGRFRGRFVKPTSGNVHLRVAQYETAGTETGCVPLARSFVRGKVANCRFSVMRSERDSGDDESTEALRSVADQLKALLKTLERPGGLDEIRGLEGEAARTYFGAFDAMLRRSRSTFSWEGRSRRPPRDPLNALLSFLYAVLLSDCVAAVESVGLDPQLGFLHGVRSGRPGLALDLEEEFRPVLADRLAFTLINRKQVAAGDFDEQPGGAVSLTEDGRRTVLIAYQEMKEREITHELLDRTMMLGLVPFVQARLLARTLRGDLEQYPPFAYR